MADIVISEFMDEAALEPLSAAYSVLYDPKLVDDPRALHAALGDAKALVVRNRTQVRADVLDVAPGLTCVGRLGVGLDNIDMALCKARGIAVYPATGANDRSVAEYVMAAALLLRRGAFAATEEVASGAWPRQALMGSELTGVTFGLLGLGNIARDVAHLASAFGVTMIAHDPHLPEDHPAWQSVRPVSFDDLIVESDVLSLHVPLTDETRNIIGADALAAMKPGAILINAARGGIVDEAAVCDALKAGTLGGAALDVFDAEPVSAETGRIFSKVPNLILTPHIAGVTREANVRVSRVTVDNVLRHLQSHSQSVT